MHNSQAGSRSTVISEVVVIATFLGTDVSDRVSDPRRLTAVPVLDMNELLSGGD